MKILVTTLLVSALSMILIPSLVIAQAEGETESPREFLDTVGSAGGYGNVAAGEADISLARMLGRIVRAAVSVVGVLFSIYVIYGGYLWMTAAGNDDKIDKAKTIIRNGTIGLIVIALSFGIYILATSFIAFAGADF